MIAADDLSFLGDEVGYPADPSGYAALPAGTPIYFTAQGEQAHALFAATGAQFAADGSYLGFDAAALTMSNNGTASTDGANAREVDDLFTSAALNNRDNKGGEGAGAAGEDSLLGGSS